MNIIKQFARQIKSELGAMLERWRKPNRVPQKQAIIAEPAQPQGRVKKVRATKAYADQRQKAKRHRRRKPSRAMKNLYRLDW